MKEKRREVTKGNQEEERENFFLREEKSLKIYEEKQHKYINKKGCDHGNWEEIEEMEKRRKLK